MAKINNKFDLYKDVFIPPKDYEIQFVEFATYSLSKSFLTALPAIIYCANTETPLASLTSIIKRNDFIKYGYFNKFHVFYHGKRNDIATACADDGFFFRSPLAPFAIRLKNQRCTPVVSANNGLFHPKIILLQFAKKDDKENIRFRLVISSRNLTWANYFETGMILEGVVDGEKEPDQNITAPLCAFFDTYYEDYEDKTQSGINWDKLKKAHFEAKETSDEKSISDIKLLFATDKDKGTLLQRMKGDMVSYDSCHIISMKPTIGMMKKTDGQELACSYICNFGDMYKNTEHGGWEKKDVTADKWFVANETTGKIIPENIHSKMYIFFKSDDKTKYSVWMGSANCSKNALCGNNEEAMLHYTVKENEPEISPLDMQPFYKNGNIAYFLKNNDTFQSNQIDYEPFDDEFPSLKIGISNVERRTEYNGDKITKIIVSFKLKNNENCAVSVRSSRQKLNAGVTVEANQEKEFSFEYKPKYFSDIILVEKNGVLFEIGLEDYKNNEWPGLEIKHILEKLPIEVPFSLAELIRPVKGAPNTDTPYERLIRNKIENADNFVKVVNNALADIDTLIKCYNENSLETSENDENDDIYFEQQKERYERLKDQGLFKLKTELEKFTGDTNGNNIN